MTLASSPRNSNSCSGSIGATQKPAGAIDVDATQPLHLVVDEVLGLAQLRRDERLDADTVVQARVRRSVSPS